MEAFNGKIAEFHELLGALDMDYTGEIYDQSFEVYKESYLCGINKLKSFNELSQFEQQNIYDIIKSLGKYTVEEIIAILENIWKPLILIGIGWNLLSFNDSNKIDMKLIKSKHYIGLDNTLNLLQHFLLMMIARMVYVIFLLREPE